MEFRLSVGIDLGTSNTCIYYQTLQNNCEPLHINPQSPVIPSIVSYDEINTVVGDAAKSQLKRRLRNREGQNHTIIKNAKRVLGIRYQEELSAIKNSLCFARAVKGDDEFVEFATAKGKRITPVDVYTDILKYLNREVSRRGARPVDSLVVTVPARFNYRQLFLTYDAIKRAFGKETKVLLIDEPTAAAVASNILLLEKDMTFIVYDLGGGTFDLSVLRYSNNTVECLATSGDDSIGGVRFDEVLMEYVTSREEWITFTKDLSEREINKYKKSLLEQCIDVKENLSTANSDDIIIADGKFSISILRAVFEIQIRKLVQQTINIMNETIIRAGLSKDQINQVILVGGSTKIPLIEEELTKNFDNRSVVMYNVNPWSCVAQGACMISRGWEKSNFNEFEISINGKAFTINQDLEGILYIGQPFNATDMRPESIRMTSPTGMVDMRPESIRMTSSTALVDTRPESIRMTSPTALVDMRPESVRLPLRNLSLEDKPMSIRFTETTIEQLKRRSNTFLLCYLIYSHTRIFSSTKAISHFRIFSSTKANSHFRIFSSTKANSHFRIFSSTKAISHFRIFSSTKAISHFRIFSSTKAISPARDSANSF